MSEHGRSVPAGQALLFLGILAGLAESQSTKAEPKGKGERARERTIGGQRAKKAAPKPKPEAFDPATVALPENLQTPEFQEEWSERLAERLEWSQLAPTKRERAVATLTPRQVRGQLKSLSEVAARHGIAAAIGCVRRAANAHWQGVVYSGDLEGRRGSGYGASRQEQKPAPGSTSAQLARAAEIDEQEAPSIWGSR